jgi:hypothetical protein
VVCQRVRPDPSAAPEDAAGVEPGASPSQEGAVDAQLELWLCAQLSKVGGSEGRVLQAALAKLKRG